MKEHKVWYSIMVNNNNSFHDTPSHKSRRHLQRQSKTNTHARARRTDTHILVMGSVEEESEESKTINLYTEEKSLVFSFGFKEDSEEACLTKKGREFLMTGPMYWNDHYKVPPVHIRVSEAG